MHPACIISQNANSRKIAGGPAYNQACDELPASMIKYGMEGRSGDSQVHYHMDLIICWLIYYNNYFC